MIHDDHYLIDTRTAIPNHQYKRLNALAKKHNTTVGALVREIVDRHMGHVEMPTVQLEEPLQAKTGPHLDEDEINQLIDLNGQRFNDSEIARILGRNPKSIWLHRKRLGLPRHARNGRPTKEPSQ